MSDISGPFSTLIEDWSGVTTSNVIPSGQRRWYNNVTGYNASEVIELVGDGATTIASLLKRQPNTDGAQTLYGVKTFDSTPVVPVAAPTSNTQVSNKKYVDDQITANISLPDGYIYGLETSADTDTDHDVLIATGKCKDYAGTTSMELETAITKQIDATWAAGDDAGGLFSGTVAADTTYHLFLIKKDSDGSIDAGWDTDIDCANIPAGYTAYRRIRFHITDGSSNIINTFQDGNEIIPEVPISQWSQANPGNTAILRTIDSPPNISGISAKLVVSLENQSGSPSSDIYGLWTETRQTDTTPSVSAFNVIGQGNSERSDSSIISIKADSSSQIRERWTNAGSATNSNGILIGWTDDRGQYGGK